MVHDPQQVMDLVVRRLPELLEVDAATIRLLDNGTNTFVLGAACGVSESICPVPLSTPMKSCRRCSKGSQ